MFCKYCGTALSDPVQNNVKENLGKKKPHKWFLIIPVAVLLSGAIAGFVFWCVFGGKFYRPETEQPAVADAVQQKPTVSDDPNSEPQQPTRFPERPDEAESPAEETEAELEEEILYDEKKVYIQNVTATSYCTAPSVDGQTYEPYRTVDGDYTTAWIEGRDGLGIGESLTFDFDRHDRVTKLKIYNGFLNTKYRYAINGKVTQLLVEFDDGTSRTVDMTVMQVPEDKIPFKEEELYPTEIVFDEPLSVSQMKLTILDAVPGSKYDDVCISEVELSQEIPRTSTKDDKGSKDKFSEDTPVFPDIDLGMTQAELINLLGEPDSKSYPQDRTEESLDVVDSIVYRYDDAYFEFYSPNDKPYLSQNDIPLGFIETSSPKYKLVNGLAVGSSREEVLNAFYIDETIFDPNSSSSVIYGKEGDTVGHFAPGQGVNMVHQSQYFASTDDAFVSYTYYVAPEYSEYDAYSCTLNFFFEGGSDKVTRINYSWFPDLTYIPGDEEYW